MKLNIKINLDNMKYASYADMIDEYERLIKQTFVGLRKGNDHGQYLHAVETQTERSVEVVGTWRVGI